MLQMKLCGDLVLREKCTPVSDVTPEILGVMNEMVQMMKNQNGVGLAAPQVGFTQRFLVMMNPETEQIYRMINPIIASKSEETCVMEEGCLSVLGSDNLPIYANVRRPAVVDVEWTDENNEKHRDTFDGVIARIVQHETDHLDGVLFVDHLSGAKREMVMRKVNRRH